MKLIAQIKNKTITFENEHYARHHLSKLEGKKVVLTVEKMHNKRSLKQNAYYWACLEVISNYTGHTSDELHRLFKGLYLPRREIILNKKKYHLAGSTTGLTKGGFVEYMMQIQAEAAQMGLALPSPEQFKDGLDLSTLSTE